MSKPSIDDLLAGRQSRYSLVIAVAKRAREIAAEAEENGEILLEKPVNIAIRDFVNHRYEIVEPDQEE